MKPFSKILVPHDFSDAGQQAVAVASDMARRYEASILLLHVHQTMLYSAPDSFILYSSEQITELMKSFEAQLATVQQTARAAGALQVDTKVIQGTPVAEIVNFARDGGYDLIVMGTHGRSGLSHALIGSVAERVVRKAHCPVLTVRMLDAKGEARHE